QGLHRKSELAILWISQFRRSGAADTNIGRREVLMQTWRSDMAIYRRLFLQARPYWLHIAGIFLLSLLDGPLGLVAPLPLKIAVDSGIGSHPLPRVLDRVLPGRLTSFCHLSLHVGGDVLRDVPDRQAAGLGGNGGSAFSVFAFPKISADFS